MCCYGSVCFPIKVIAWENKDDNIEIGRKVSQEKWEVSSLAKRPSWAAQTIYMVTKGELCYFPIKSGKLTSANEIKIEPTYCEVFMAREEAMGKYIRGELGTVTLVSPGDPTCALPSSHPLPWSPGDTGNSVPSSPPMCFPIVSSLTTNTMGFVTQMQTSAGLNPQRQLLRNRV